MKLQTHDLVMFALGCEGGPRLWDNRPMEDGIHLRWGFRQNLGYPLGGFELYRRPHLKGDPICVGFPQERGTSYPSPWQVDNIILTSDRSLRIGVFSSPASGTFIGVALDVGTWMRVTFAELARWVRITVAAESPVVLTAYHGPIPLGSVEAMGSASPEELVVEADAIDAVELSHAQGVVLDVCHVPVSQGDSVNWERLNTEGPIGLPVTHPEYPVTHNAPDDTAEAASRVPPEAWVRYEYEAWEALHEQLIELVRNVIGKPMTSRRRRYPGRTIPQPPPNTREPELEILPLQQTLAAALDHNLARILGLYWLDETALPNQVYDYMIVGHWERGGRDTCPTATRVDFSRMQVNRIFGPAFKHQGLFFFGFPGFEVIEEPSPWDAGNNRALQLPTWFPLFNLQTRIVLPRPVVEAQVYIQADSPGAELRAYEGGKLVDSGTANERAAILTVNGKAIDYVELTGDRPRLFSICYLTEENASGDRSWIVYNVRRSVPTPLQVPSGTKAVQLPGMAIPNPDGTMVAGTNSMAVRWALPVERGEIEPGRAVMYPVQRQFLGNGGTAQPIDPDGFKEVNPYPVLVTRPRVWTVIDEGTISAPSEWGLERGSLVQKSNIYEPYRALADLPMRGTCALAGRLEWTDYRLTVRLRSDDDDAIGVVFRYQNQNNYYRFSMDSSRHYRRLVKCYQGKFQLLWNDAVSFNVKQSYELKIVVRGNRLQGWLDNALIFDEYDKPANEVLTHGQIGLYCWGNTGAQFHYVQVTPPTADGPAFFEDDFQKSLIMRQPSGWPSYPTYLIDQGLSDGWYAYRTAGIDIFGRLSEYSQPYVIEALDRTPPPPPLLVEAKALQAKPKGVPESVLDKTFTKAEKEWLKAHPEGGIKVEWIWTGELRRQAPDAAEFRIYFQPGQMNTIAGRVTKVSSQGKTSTLTTDRATKLPPNAFKNEWVRVGINMFKVTASGTGTNFSLTVDNLTNPDRVTDKKAPEWIIPVKAAFSLTLSAGKSGQINYRNPRHWEERIYVEPLAIPQGTLATPTGQITQRLVHNDGTCTITTNATLNDSSTAPLTVPGVLVSDGQVFYAQTHTAGANFQVKVRSVGNGNNPVLPAVGRTFVYYPGYRYSVTLPGLRLKPTEAVPVAYGQIGISTADNKAHKYAKDDPARSSTPWGDRLGNEGPVSPPHTVFAVKRIPPDKPPDPPPEPEKVFAEPADYYGHSRYTLRWFRAANDKNLRYQVYRAVDSSLFAVDKKTWTGRPFNANDVGPSYLNPGRWPTVAGELNKLNQASPNYEALPRDAFQVLASLRGNEAAFTLLTSKPLDPTDPSNQDSEDPSGQTLKFTDVLDGRASNCYFYRVAVVDLAGNRSDFAASSPAIYLPDTTPPRAPLPVKVLGGERKVTLTWQANREPGMDRYLIYRTTDRDKAEDIRLMGDPFATVLQPQTTRVLFEDKDLPGPITYYYRLVAVRKGETGPKASDVLDLFSNPSVVLAARTFDETPPDPPTWVRAEWVLVDEKGNEYSWGTTPSPGQTYMPAVSLEWTSKDTYARWIVQRKLEGTDLWRRISPWLNGVLGAGKYIDASAFPDTSYVYRIHIEDLSGKVNSKFNEQILHKVVS